MIKLVLEKDGVHKLSLDKLRARLEEEQLRMKLEQSLELQEERKEDKSVTLSQRIQPTPRSLLDSIPCKVTLSKVLREDFKL